MWTILEHRRARKRLRRLPVETLKRYEKWKDIVMISGPRAAGSEPEPARRAHWNPAIDDLGDRERPDQSRRRARQDAGAGAPRASGRDRVSRQGRREGVGRLSRATRPLHIQLVFDTLGSAPIINSAACNAHGLRCFGLGASLLLAAISKESPGGRSSSTSRGSPFRLVPASARRSIPHTRVRGSCPGGIPVASLCRSGPSSVNRRVGWCSPFATSGRQPPDPLHCTARKDSAPHPETPAAWPSPTRRGGKEPGVNDVSDILDGFGTQISGSRRRRA